MTRILPPGTRTIRLIVAYDGTAYAGWQIQPAEPTIQGILTEVASRIMDHPVKVLGASRTDAGVHARHQVAAFDTPSPRPAPIIARGLNAMLPPDIRIVLAEDARPGFHPRFDAVEKTYRYRLFTGAELSPFDIRYATHIRGRVDVSAMERAAAHLEGTHDFASFRDSQCSARTTVRSISHSSFQHLSDGFLEYIITGNRFLHHMVRIIVGTLLWVGRGKLDADGITELFARKDRRFAGPTAPAKGLFLEHIVLKEDDHA